MQPFTIALRFLTVEARRGMNTRLKKNFRHIFQNRNTSTFKGNKYLFSVINEVIFKILWLWYPERKSWFICRAKECALYEVVVITFCVLYQIIRCQIT